MNQPQVQCCALRNSKHRGKVSWGRDGEEGGSLARREGWADYDEAQKCGGCWEPACGPGLDPEK